MTLGTVWRQEDPLWNPFTVHLGKGGPSAHTQKCQGAAKKTDWRATQELNSSRFGGHLNVGGSEDEPEVSNWEIRLVVIVLVPDQDTRGE